MRRPKFLKSTFRAIQKEAKKTADLNRGEVCGLILDNGSFLELIRVRNKSKSGGGFSFYFNEIRTIQKMASLLNHEIVGTFHSHPVGLANPGPADLRHTVDGSIMLIFDVMGRSAWLWRIKRKRGRQLQFSLI